MQRLDKKNPFVVSPKAKFVPTDYSANCTAGCGWVRVTPKGTCPACGAQILRKKTFQSIADRFNEIIEHNRTALNGHFFGEFEKDSIKIPVKMEKETFFIPLRYFIEFENLQQTEHDFGTFFEYIKKVCPSVRF